MKKAITTLLMCLLATFFVVAQDFTDRDKFKLGLHGSLPIGDASEISNFGLGIDLAYQYGVSKVFDIGAATGFTNAFIETDDQVEQSSFDNVQFLPVAALLRIYPHVRSRFSFGADVGYAVGINEGNEGGLYYRPTLAFNIGRGTELMASYTGIELDGGNWNTVNAGVLFIF